MPVALGAKPQADFSEPIDLLMDCHRRIERFMGILQQITANVGGGALNDEHREALETALNYFHAAAPRHNEDEERSLFPLVRQSEDPMVREALVKVDALEADHREAEPRHARVDALGRKWLQENRLRMDETSELKNLLDTLAAGYQQHIAIEDCEVFPLAQKVLSGEQLAALGHEMKQRRMSDPGRPGSRCAHRRQARDT